jgi:hypothetical protein
MNNTFEFSNGKTVTFGYDAISYKEWRSWIRGELSAEEDDRMVAKVCGLKDKELDEIYSLPQPEVKRFLRKMLMYGQNPLADPNSASESISES